MAVFAASVRVLVTRVRMNTLILTHHFATVAESLSASGFGQPGGGDGQLEVDPGVLRLLQARGVEDGAARSSGGPVPGLFVYVRESLAHNSHTVHRLRA